MVNYYPLFYKIIIIEFYMSRKCKITEIIKIFKISKSSLYNWISQHIKNKLTEKKKYTNKSKITDKIKIYIIKYIKIK